MGLPGSEADLLGGRRGDWLRRPGRLLSTPLTLRPEPALAGPPLPELINHQVHHSDHRNIQVLRFVVNQIKVVIAQGIGSAIALIAQRRTSCAGLAPVFHRRGIVTFVQNVCHHDRCVNITATLLVCDLKILFCDSLDMSQGHHFGV